MHGEQRDRVLSAHRGGVEFLRRGFVLQEVEVVQEGLERWGAADRTPCVCQVEEPIEVEAG